MQKHMQALVWPPGGSVERWTQESPDLSLQRLTCTPGKQSEFSEIL